MTEVRGNTMPELIVYLRAMKFKRLYQKGIFIFSEYEIFHILHREYMTHETAQKIHTNVQATWLGRPCMSSLRPFSYSLYCPEFYLCVSIYTVFPSVSVSNYTSAILLNINLG